MEHFLYSILFMHLNVPSTAVGNDKAKFPRVCKVEGGACQEKRTNKGTRSLPLVMRVTERGNNSSRRTALAADRQINRTFRKCHWSWDLNEIRAGSQALPTKGQSFPGRELARTKFLQGKSACFFPWSNGIAVNIGRILSVHKKRLQLQSLFLILLTLWPIFWKKIKDRELKKTIKFLCTVYPGHSTRFCLYKVLQFGKLQFFSKKELIF